MTEVRACDLPLVRVPENYFCGDSVRKGAALYNSGHVSDVTAVWDDNVTIRAKCLPQTSVNKLPYEVELIVSTPLSL